MRERGCVHKQASDFSAAMHRFELHVAIWDSAPPDVLKAYEAAHALSMKENWVLPDADTGYYFGLIEAFLLHDRFVRRWTDSFPDDTENQLGLNLATANMYLLAKIAFDYIREDMEAADQQPDWVPDDIGERDG